MARAISSAPAPSRRRTVVGLSCVAVLTGALGSLLLVPGGCRTVAPIASKPGAVRLAIGYAGPGDVPTAGLRSLGFLISSERLVQARRDGRLEPALLERWEQSADGLTWWLYLRPELTFHNGRRIDAGLVAALLRECQRAAAILGCRDIVSVEPQDPLTIAIKLRQPSGLLLEALYLLAINADKERVVSSGPFRAVPDQERMVFEAFPNYYRGVPAIDRIDLKLFPSARNAWAAMMRGEIDMLYEVAPEALEFIEQSSNMQVRSFLRPYVFTMGLNVRHPILKDRDVRRALNLAVNRTEIIDRLLRGHGYPATDHIWPRHWASRHDLPRLHYDPVEAVRLLDARGLQMPVVARTETPSRFHFTCLIPEKDGRFERMALLLQRQLIEVGVDMRIEAISAAEFLQRLPYGKFDAFLLDLIAQPSMSRVYQWWHSPTGQAELVDAGYTAADAALDRIREARTEDDTREAIGALQKVMRDDPPAVFLFWSETARAVNSRFRVPLTPDRDIVSTLPQWQLSPPSP